MAFCGRYLFLYLQIVITLSLSLGELLVSDYNLVPKHELLSESETKSVAKKFNVSIDKFPRILESDPQLIAIHRNDGTENYLYYRYVVKG
jgi:DNA-directed RNA polymerase subunit H (RpoH/RPB5)